MRVIVAGLSLLLTVGAAPAPDPVDLDIVLTGLRSEAGKVHVCLWHMPNAFPDCGKGVDVQKLSAPAAKTVTIHVAGLRPGAYAISAMHDENGNQKLDKSALGLPTEGVGFSNNPKLIFGPPPYARTRFEADASTAQTVRMKYFL
jgi:uncharacterized protein (DUF2141 family)